MGDIEEARICWHEADNMKETRVFFRHLPRVGDFVEFKSGQWLPVTKVLWPMRGKWPDVPWLYLGDGEPIRGTLDTRLGDPGDGRR